MELENDELELEFKQIEDVSENNDSFIAKGLFLNQCLEEENYDFVEDLLSDIVDEINNTKEDK